MGAVGCRPAPSCAAHRRSKSAVSLVEFSWDPDSGQARQVRPASFVLAPAGPCSRVPLVFAPARHRNWVTIGSAMLHSGRRLGGHPCSAGYGSLPLVCLQTPCCRFCSQVRSPVKPRTIEEMLAPRGGAAALGGAACLAGCSPCGVASAAASSSSQPSSATSSLAAQLADLQVTSRQSSGSDLGDRGRLLAGLPPGLAALHTRRASACEGGSAAGEPASPPDSSCSPQQVGAIKSFDTVMLRSLTPIKTRSRPGTARQHDGGLPPSPPAPLAGTLVSPFGDCPSASSSGSGLRPKLAAGRPVVIRCSTSSAAGGGAPNAYNPYDLTAAALYSGGQGWRGFGRLWMHAHSHEIAGARPPPVVPYCAICARARAFHPRPPPPPSTPLPPLPRALQTRSMRQDGYPFSCLDAAQVGPPCPHLAGAAPPPAPPAEFRSPARSSLASPFPSSSRTTSSNVTPSQWLAGSGGHRASAYRALAAQQALTQVGAGHACWRVQP